jgi:hypothetical protein
LKNVLRRLRDWQVCCLIALAGIAVYGKSIAYGFTYSDDIPFIVTNEEFLGNLANMPKLFTTDVFVSMANPHVYYRPLFNLLFMLEIQIAGDAPLVYHVTNILLHLACSILVYALFRRLNLAKILAGAAALLFCVHPLHSSAVVWIPGRNDTLLTLFVLGSFLCFLRAMETKRAAPFIGHLILFFFALLTKEIAIVVPVLSIGYALFVKRPKMRIAEGFSLLFIYVLLAALWFFMRSMVPQTFEVQQSVVSQIMSWLSNTPALILFFGKVILPFNLSIFPNLTDHSLIYGAVGIVLFLGVMLARRPKSWKHIVWGLGWFVLFLAPALVVGPIFREDRAYCASIGLLLAITHLPLVQRINLSKTIHAIGFCALVILFAALTMVHEEQYRDRAAYVTSAYASAPGIDESYSGLAGMLMDEGNDEAAERILRAGIERKPAMKIVHRMLGDIYARRREYAMAAGEYEASLRLEPLHLYTYINYGKMCLEANRIDDAARLWKTSVLINPDFLLGYYYLANCYIHCKSDPDSAMIYVRELQRRGVAVLPELLRAIENHPPMKGKKP